MRGTSLRVDGPRHVALPSAASSEANIRLLHAAASSKPFAVERVGMRRVSRKRDAVARTKIDCRDGPTTRIGTGARHDVWPVGNGLDQHPRPSTSPLRYARRCERSQYLFQRLFLGRRAYSWFRRRLAQRCPARDARSSDDPNLVLVPSAHIRESLRTECRRGRRAAVGWSTWSVFAVLSVELSGMGAWGGEESHTVPYVPSASSEGHPGWYGSRAGEHRGAR